MQVDIVSWLFLQLIGGLLLADFITGIFHWLEDTYCTFNFPGWLGKNVCDPNLLHHKEQRSFLKSSFLNRNYIQMILGLPLLILGCYLWAPFLVFMYIFVSISNEVHAWAHAKAPAPVRVFQEMGLLQSPRQHAAHHRSPYESHYCTLTNFINPLLEAATFWRSLELTLENLFGLKSKRAANNLELQNAKSPTQDH